MKCNAVKKTLPAFADGELERGIKEKVRAHLVSCQDCMRHAEELVVAWELLDRYRGPVVPGDLTSRIMSKVAEAPLATSRAPVPVSSWHVTAALRYATALAATFLLVFGVVWFTPIRELISPLSQEPELSPEDREVVEMLDILADMDLLSEYDLMEEVESVDAYEDYEVILDEYF